MIAPLSDPLRGACGAASAAPVQLDHTGDLALAGRCEGLGAAGVMAHGDGRCAAVPRLDGTRLERLRAVTDVPPALDGTSGLAEDDVRRAVMVAVATVNVNTELRAAWLRAAAGRRLALLAPAQPSRIRQPTEEER